MDSSNAKNQTQSLIARLATKFGVEPGKLLKCLTSQVFKQSDGAVPTNVGWGAKFGPEGSSIIGSPSGNPE